MIQLVTFMYILIVLFAVIGALRGFAKELIAAAGIILALFATWQFSGLFLQPLLQGARPEQYFWVYSLILIGITFFAYQTPTAAARLSDSRFFGRRDGLQERILGFFLGGLNGWLTIGSLWYYMDVTGYPLAPYVVAPAAGSASADMVRNLPLIFLVQGNFLTVLVVVIFLFLIIAIV